jgi:hypothetical protein
MTHQPTVVALTLELPASLSGEYLHLLILPRSVGAIVWLSFMLRQSLWLLILLIPVTVIQAVHGTPQLSE